MPSRRVFLSSCATPMVLRGARAGQPRPAEPDPLALEFRRMAVRRFIFSNNIPLSELAPGEIVGLDVMHPASGSCRYSIAGGRLEVSNPSGGTAESAMFVGGVNPYGTYEVDVHHVEGNGEIAIDIADIRLRRRVMVAVRHGAASEGIVFRLFEHERKVREHVLWAGAAPACPYKLRVQLTGTGLSSFVTSDGQTEYRGHTAVTQWFHDVFDLRARRIHTAMKFNLATRLEGGGKALVNGARSFLSAGVGQADIRLVTHKNGAPFIEDNRLWFTFSARGLNISDSSQGVMSLDPSIFDPRLEGMIVFDEGDGLLRNDIASQLFYDDDDRVWRAFTCNFSRNPDGGRSGSGLGTAWSKHDPRRRFSVMRGASFALEDKHEDPCTVFDAEAGKWRLLTTRLRGMRAELFEADRWDGPYRKIAGPVDHDSTGTSIQKIGSRRYVFAGSSERAIFVYSYPELKLLGKLKMDTPPFNAQTNGRVWGNVFPLPVGYPARYAALTMDRPNFPGVRGPNWSYGALYLYHAYTEELGSDTFEY